MFGAVKTNNFNSAKPYAKVRRWVLGVPSLKNEHWTTYSFLWVPK